MSKKLYSHSVEPRYLPMVDAVLAFLTVVGTPAISAGIALAAWRGKPGSFNRERFGLTAAAAFLAFLLVSIPCMKLRSADVRTSLYFAEIASFCLLLALFGVFVGCLLGVFIYRKGDSLIERALRSHPQAR